MADIRHNILDKKNKKREDINKLDIGEKESLLSEDGMLLQYIDDDGDPNYQFIIEELRRIALYNNHKAIKFIKNPSLENHMVRLRSMIQSISIRNLWDIIDDVEKKAKEDISNAYKLGHAEGLASALKINQQPIGTLDSYNDGYTHGYNDCKEEGEKK